MTSFQSILVTTQGNVRFLLPVANIEAIREPMENDVLSEGTKTIIITRIGLSLFVQEDFEHFVNLLPILRRMDA